MTCWSMIMKIGKPNSSPHRSVREDISAWSRGVWPVGSAAVGRLCLIFRAICWFRLGASGPKLMSSASRYIFKMQPLKLEIPYLYAYRSIVIDFWAFLPTQESQRCCRFRGQWHRTPVHRQGLRDAMSSSRTRLPYRGFCRWPTEPGGIIPQGCPSTSPRKRILLIR